MRTSRIARRRIRYAGFLRSNLSFMGRSIREASVNVPSGPWAWLAPQVAVCVPSWAVVANYDYTGGAN